MPKAKGYWEYRYNDEPGQRIQSTQTQPPSTEPPGRDYTFSITAEWVVLGMAAGSLVFQRILRPWILDILKKLVGRRPYTYDIELEQILAQIVGRSEACRAVVYEFHNGEKLFSGRPLEKVTITCEHCNRGYSSITKEFSSSPITKISTTLEELEKEPYLVREVNSSSDDSHVRFLQGLYVNKVINVLLLIHDRPIGILEVQFNDRLSKTDPDDLKEDLIRLTEQIMGVITKASESKSIVNALVEVATLKGKS